MRMFGNSDHVDFLWTCVCGLLQVSQYTFAMCSYREKKSEPQELMQLEGYTVDYCEPQPGRRKWDCAINRKCTDTDIMNL